MRSAWNAYIFCGVLALVGIADTYLADSQDQSKVHTVPFAVAIVPGSAGITMAQNNADQFYVVLTNISEAPHPVWNGRNSWAYRNISFEITIPDGQKFVISEATQEFTRNFPSTAVIEPGEHQVYASRLDKWWKSDPQFPKVDAMPVRLKAIYEVHPIPESVKYKVWTGRVESRTYQITLRQW